MLFSYEDLDKSRKKTIGNLNILRSENTVDNGV